MFPPLPSANLHFSNTSQGLSLSIPLWRFAIFSSTNPCALCLQNFYMHLPSQRIKVTLQEGQHICFFHVKPSYRLCFTPFSCSCLCWWGGVPSIGLMVEAMCCCCLFRCQDAKQLVSWGTNHQDVSEDFGNLSLSCQKPFLSFLLFLF